MTHVECLFEVPQIFYIDGLLHLVYLLRSLAHQGGTAAASQSWLWNASRLQFLHSQASSELRTLRCCLRAGESHTSRGTQERWCPRYLCVHQGRGEDVLRTPMPRYRAVLD